CRDILPLHQERVRRQHRAITHRHPVMDEGPDTDRAPGAKRGSARLIGAVLLRVALDLASLIEDTIVPNGGQGRLGDVNAIVEHPLADANTDEPPKHVLERRAIENVEEVDRMKFPNALHPPETGVVDGAD